MGLPRYDGDCYFLADFLNFALSFAKTSSAMKNRAILGSDA